MSNTTHTPGPWAVCGYDVRRPAGRLVAYTGPHHTQPEEYPKSCKLEDEANARLIAAAPDLLAACKAALAALSQPMTYPADIAAAKKWLTDAAAKAEGRA